MSKKNTQTPTAAPKNLAASTEDDQLQMQDEITPGGKEQKILTKINVPRFLTKLSQIPLEQKLELIAGLNAQTHDDRKAKIEEYKRKIKELSGEVDSENGHATL